MRRLRKTFLHQPCAQHGNQASAESGLALMEFLISVPFLLIMSTAIIDIAMVLNQYMLITSAVHAGVRMGTGATGLDTSDYAGLYPNVPVGCTVLAGSAKHAAIQSRVFELVSLNNRRIDATTLCISSGVRTAAGPRNNTVYVRVAVRYRGFFPAFNGLPITVEASGPLMS